MVKETNTLLDEATIDDGNIIDYITNEKKKDSSKEKVRQRIAQTLFEEYGILTEDMQADFPVRVNGRRKTVDIAIFHHGHEHTVLNMSRAVICRPEPQVGKGATRLRDYSEAKRDLEDLEDIMSEVDSCLYGLWTNNLEFYYLEKEQTRFDVRMKPVGDWPVVDESLDQQDRGSRIRTRRGEPETLRIAFRRCHNFIHGNEGMPKDAAFWQFLYLIFCKMHDEKFSGNQRRFWVGPYEQFDEQGRKEIRKRIMPLFEEVKQQYKDIFRSNDEITLSDRALAFMVSELAKYDFTRSNVDAKGAAYQEIVGTNLRGDRGQYFTPKGVVTLAAQILDPQENERILDPACGTGGFLVATLKDLMDKFRAERNVPVQLEDTQDFLAVHDRLRTFAEKNVFGADFDRFLIKATQMNMVMAGDGHGHLYHMNSLEYPAGELGDTARARKDIPFESIDVIMTNPPFGSDIPITDQSILRQYELAYQWESKGDGTFRQTSRLQSKVAPEILFIERCFHWLKPKGRMGIVLPNGILGNPAAEYIRWWILKQAWVLASIDLPVEVFIVEANVNILTSLLFLKKKTSEEIRAESLGGTIPYPIFMAVAEKVGFDRRGNRINKRKPNGEDIIIKEEKITYIPIKGQIVERRNEVAHPIIDDDLPVIAEKYKEFRTHYPEPGQ